MLLNKDSKLADAIFKDPSLIPVLDRFGIKLGIGDSTVEFCCNYYEVNTDFFLAVVNTFLSDEFIADEELTRFPPQNICDYLSSTDNYYSSVQLPNIERHFNSLIELSKDKENNLSMLKKFFIEMKEEFLSAIEYDRMHLFPALRGDSRFDIDMSARDDVEEKIADLLAFFVLHLKGDYNNNLCTAVVSAIFMLQKDVSQNNRIRRKLLRSIKN